jgi:catechol 2,3-dioxygenase-like lactoylglutathione lyase family enzyme
MIGQGVPQAMRIDHVAVDAAKLGETVSWYVERFSASVLYQDSTWAFLRIGGSKLALVTPGEHPPHIAFAVTDAELEQLARQHNLAIRPHRDGTRSFYTTDPSGNSVEFISYPPGNAYEAKSGLVS